MAMITPPVIAEAPRPAAAALTPMISFSRGEMVWIEPNTVNRSDACNAPQAAGEEPR